MYYIYMIRCIDNSLYTGITTDLQRRLKEHKEKTEKCAKYTLSHDAQKLEIAWQTENRADALRLEYHIKQLSKKNKEALIVGETTIEKIFTTKIQGNIYKLNNKCI